MSYCSAQDLTDRYGTEVLAWADRDHDGTPDPALVAAMLADVDAEIDAFLAARYTLPLSATPPVINRIACALARERFAVAGGARMDAADPIRADADGVRKLLQAISTGKAGIGLPTPVAATGTVQMQTGGRDWNRADSEGFL